MHEFFLNLSLTVNTITTSCKHQDELQLAQADHVVCSIALDELETGTSLNQVGTLKIHSDTHWSSHFASISSLIKMYDATCKVIDNIKNDGGNYKSRGDVVVALKKMTSFEFIFIVHLMYEILGTTDTLCQSLQ